MLGIRFCTDPRSPEERRQTENARQTAVLQDPRANIRKKLSAARKLARTAATQEERAAIPLNLTATQGRSEAYDRSLITLAVLSETKKLTPRGARDEIRYDQAQARKQAASLNSSGYYRAHHLEKAARQLDKLSQERWTPHDHLTVARSALTKNWETPSTEDSRISSAAYAFAVAVQGSDRALEAETLGHIHRRTTNRWFWFDVSSDAHHQILDTMLYAGARGEARPQFIEAFHALARAACANSGQRHLGPEQRSGIWNVASTLKQREGLSRKWVDALTEVQRKVARP